jgi:hypothetical protein
VTNSFQVGDDFSGDRVRVSRNWSMGNAQQVRLNASFGEAVGLLEKNLACGSAELWRKPFKKNVELLTFLP